MVMSFFLSPNVEMRRTDQKHRHESQPWKGSNAGVGKCLKAQSFSPCQMTAIHSRPPGLTSTQMGHAVRMGKIMKAVPGRTVIGVGSPGDGQVGAAFGCVISI